MPAERVERRRRTAFEMNLDSNLVTGYQRTAVDEKDSTRLPGKISDDEVARRTGRTPATAGPRNTRRLARYDAKSREVARRLGRLLASMTQKRFKVRIEAAPRT